MSVLVGDSSTSARKNSLFPTPESSSQYLKVDPTPSSLVDFKPKPRPELARHMSGDPNLLRVSEHPRPSRVMRTLSETAEAISTPPQSSTISRKLSFRQNNSDSQPESLVTPILRKMSLIPTDPVQLPKLKKSLYQPTPAQEMSKDSEDQNYQTLQYHTEPYRYF